jgi:hypothetical protein
LYDSADAVPQISTFNQVIYYWRILIYTYFEMCSWNADGAGWTVVGMQ